MNRIVRGLIRTLLGCGLFGMLASGALAEKAETVWRASGDLGVVIERASGSVLIVEHSHQQILGRVDGLGDLSHASVVFSRDQHYAYVFGRDGGLSKVDLLRRQLSKRIVQSGNAIGGAISQDGRLVVAQNYEPGGIKAFDAETLALVADVLSPVGANGKPAKVVGLADLPGQRFAYALFDADALCVTDLSKPAVPDTHCYRAGRQPYDGLVTPDGRYYLAGLFGEDGLALLDTWQPERGVQRILAGYGRGEAPLPVYKMPHLRGWAMANGQLYLPAIGRHEVLVVDARTWQETARIAVASQPVFVMARPDGREIWVNFAFPDNGTVQVIDTLKQTVSDTLSPGRAILHLEFTPRGEQVWLSSRDDNRLSIYRTATHELLKTLPAESPSGIFFTTRAGRIGF